MSYAGSYWNSLPPLDKFIVIFSFPKTVFLFPALVRFSTLIPVNSTEPPRENKKE